MRSYIFETSLGWVAWLWSAKGLYALTLPTATPAEARAALGNGIRLVEVWTSRGAQRGKGALVGALTAYLKGERTSFEAVPVDWSGYTPFVRQVLRAVRHIPWGTTVTYGDVANVIGNQNAARAVGNALGRNRTPLVVPCHRVVSADGKPGGWSGPPGWKERLLRNEGCLSRRGLEIL